MLYTKFQTSEPGGSDKKMFKYISMHFYDLYLGSQARSHLWHWNLHLNNLCKGLLGNATYQISRRFLIYISMHLYGLNVGPPGPEPSLTLGPSFGLGELKVGLIIKHSTKIFIANIYRPCPDNNSRSVSSLGSKVNKKWNSQTNIGNGMKNWCS